MKVLTIIQPWATLIAKGIKQVENRKWATGYRGPLVIHAGKKKSPQDWEAADAALDGTGFDLDSLGDIPFGGIVGIVDLWDVRRFDEKDLPEDLLLDPFFMGDAFGWRLQNAREVTWWPCPGQLGLWELDYSLEPLPEPVIAPGAIALQQDIFGGVTPIYRKRQKPTQLGLLV